MTVNIFIFLRKNRNKYINALLNFLLIDSDNKNCFSRNVFKDVFFKVITKGNLALHEHRDTF